MNYACYNILSTIAILGPFGAHIRKRSTVYAGLGLGSGMLLVIALSVMTCLAVWPAAQSHELPMLAAAAGLGAVPMYVYALLLFAGMFGSALSNAVAFVNYCCAKLTPLRARKAAFTVLAVLLALSRQPLRLRQPDRHALPALRLRQRLVSGAHASPRCSPVPPKDAVGSGTGQPGVRLSRHAPAVSVPVNLNIDAVQLHAVLGADHDVLHAAERPRLNEVAPVRRDHG